MTNEELREKCEGALVACHPCEEMMDIARACLALLEANRWRKCEEEMPPKDTLVWGWPVEGDRMAECQWDDDVEFDHPGIPKWWTRDAAPAGNVTHWRPLPEPPKEGT